MDMYQENILDHGRNPRHWGLLEAFDLHGEDDNPSCGDQLEITVKLDENNNVAAIGWTGEGCTISQASASILGEEIIGKSLDEIRGYDKDELLDILGIPISMNRMKCALLSLKVMKAAAYDLENVSEDGDNV